MAEESDEALEISSHEESGTDRDDTKESMDQSTSESLQSGSLTIISLLDRLRSPTPETYPDCRGKPKGGKTGNVKEKGGPKHISACEQVKLYPNEEFIVRSSKLFCCACMEVLALKNSSIEYHIKSSSNFYQASASPR